MGHGRVGGRCARRRGSGLLPLVFWLGVALPVGAWADVPFTLDTVPVAPDLGALMALDPRAPGVWQGLCEAARQGQVIKPADRARVSAMLDASVSRGARPARITHLAWPCLEQLGWSAEAVVGRELAWAGVRSARWSTRPTLRAHWGPPPIAFYAALLRADGVTAQVRGLAASRLIELGPRFPEAWPALAAAVVAMPLGPEGRVSHTWLDAAVADGVEVAAASVCPDEQPWAPLVVGALVAAAEAGDADARAKLGAFEPPPALARRYAALAAGAQRMDGRLARAGPAVWRALAAEWPADAAPPPVDWRAVQPSGRCWSAEQGRAGIEALIGRGWLPAGEVTRLARARPPVPQAVSRPRMIVPVDRVQAGGLVPPMERPALAASSDAALWAAARGRDDAARVVRDPALLRRVEPRLAKAAADAPTLHAIIDAVATGPAALDARMMRSVMDAARDEAAGAGLSGPAPESLGDLLAAPSPARWPRSPTPDLLPFARRALLAAALRDCPLAGPYLLTPLLRGDPARFEARRARLPWGPGRCPDPIAVVRAVVADGAALRDELDPVWFGEHSAIVRSASPDLGRAVDGAPPPTLDDRRARALWVAWTSDDAAELVALALDPAAPRAADVAAERVAYVLTQFFGDGQPTLRRMLASPVAGVRRAAVSGLRTALVGEAWASRRRRGRLDPELHAACVSMAASPDRGLADAATLALLTTDPKPLWPILEARLRDGPPVIGPPVPPVGEASRRWQRPESSARGERAELAALLARYLMAVGSKAAVARAEVALAGVTPLDGLQDPLTWPHWRALPPGEWAMSRPAGHPVRFVGADGALDWLGARLARGDATPLEVAARRERPGSAAIEEAARRLILTGEAAEVAHQRRARVAPPVPDVLLDPDAVSLLARHAPGRLRRLSRAWDWRLRASLVRELAALTDPPAWFYEAAVEPHPDVRRQAFVGSSEAPDAATRARLIDALLPVLGAPGPHAAVPLACDEACADALALHAADRPEAVLRLASAGMLPVAPGPGPPEAQRRLRRIPTAAWVGALRLAGEQRRALRALVRALPGEHAAAAVGSGWVSRAVAEALRAELVRARAVAPATADRVEAIIGALDAALAKR